MNAAHGTWDRYNNHGCRCDECRDAGRRYRKTQAIRRAQGRPSVVDARRVRRILQDAREAGLPWSVVAQRSGVHRTTIEDIWRGDHDLVSTRVTAALLAADLATPHTGSHLHVSAVGSVRRLQALATLGWSTSAVAQRCGLSLDTIAITRRGVYRVHSSTHQAIAATYRRLITQQPPTATLAQRRAFTWVRRHADAQGWVGPLAWNDIDHDERPEQVDAYVRTPVIDSIRELQDFGLDTNQIADRLRVTKKAIENAIARSAA